MKKIKVLLLAFVILSLFGFSRNYLNNSYKPQNQYGKYQGETFKINIPLTYFNTNKNIADKNNAAEYNRSWYWKVMEDIKTDEYKISFSEEYNAYQSPNRANNFRFIYHNNGFTVKPRTTKIPLFDLNDLKIIENDKKYKTLEDWKVNFSLTGFGRENEKIKFTGEELKVNGNSASIEDDNIKITYLNDEKGMRQDFVLKKRPEGKGKFISLNFNIDTKFKTKIKENEILFIDKNNEKIFQYNNLKVTDANGKRLKANFNKLERKSYNIIVEDENALYPITIDPLSSTPNWTVEGNQEQARFGWSASTAGDVNGDGYSDVIIGAPFYDNGETNEGKAFLYFGSVSGLSTTVSWTAESNQTNAYFGWSVSTAGDVNGDGYSDVIIGAYNYNGGLSSEGRVYVFQGSVSGLPANANWSAEGESSSAYFGYSVSTAGDVNGDGYSDVIVGAYLFSNGQSGEGRTFVFHGSPSGLSTIANWTAESDQASAYFGWSVCTAGDVNGDGYNDVIVGAKFYDNGQTDEGKVFVYHGSSSGLSLTPNWTVENNVEYSSFGSSVSTAGDVNGDGYSDIIIGAYLCDNVEADEGKAYVYHGSSSGLSLTPDWTAESNQVGAYFGWSVSTAGDVTGDAYCDVIVGAYYYDNGQTDEGKAFVYYGSSSGLSDSANWTAESNQTGAQFGCCVSTVGDVNGDGISEIIVGAHFYDNGEINEGKVYVYYGSTSGLSTNANWTVLNGSSVSTAGDVNGDGYSDVIVGSCVYHGSSSGLSTTANWTTAISITSVSTAGDVNGDGYGDVIVGSGTGVYVYLGSPSGLSTTANWTTAISITSVSTAGDVNGDGYSDVIVGSGTGAYVYLGSPSGLSTTANWTIGISISSVSTAGDVNGDGYSDIIIGRSGFGFNGRVYVYHGSSSGLSTYFNWNDSIPSMVIYVSNAGDVNGDGYSDVIVGGKDDPVMNLEKVNVYHGSPTGLSTTANWTQGYYHIEIDAGLPVSTAGDVNGDGYSDVIVGNPHYNSFFSYVYLFQGSATGLSSSANWSVSGQYDYAQLGSSVSTAGDVNGDGYSDVIVNSLGSVYGQPSAYSFYGNKEIGFRSTFQQYKPGTTNIIGPQGLSGTNSQVRLNLFGKSPFGRADGKLVYEIKQENHPFSGNPITNSTSSTGSGSYTDLGTSITGVQLNQDISGIALNHEYKWRVRVQYNPVNNPYQKYGPWKYYNNYQPKPFGGFKTNSMSGPIAPILISPENNSAGISVTPMLIWDTAVGAIGYKVKVASDSTFSTIIDSATVTANHYIIPSGKLNPGTKYYWKVAGYNSYGIGLWSTVWNFFTLQNLTLNLKVYLEGFWNGTALISDTIKVYLANSTSPYGYVDSSVVFLSTNGTGIINFIRCSPGSYYIVLIHRNHLETWSALPQTINAGSPLNYDFTTARSKAYGNNLILSNGAWCIYGGDINQDGFVDGADMALLDNDLFNYTSGYVVTDVNGDQFVDGADMAILDNNLYNYIGVVRPGGSDIIKDNIFLKSKKGRSKTIWDVKMK